MWGCEADSAFLGLVSFLDTALSMCIGNGNGNFQVLSNIHCSSTCENILVNCIWVDIKDNYVCMYVTTSTLPFPLHAYIPCFILTISLQLPNLVQR